VPSSRHDENQVGRNEKRNRSTDAAHVRTELQQWQSGDCSQHDEWGADGTECYRCCVGEQADGGCAEWFEAQASSMAAATATGVPKPAAPSITLRTRRRPAELQATVRRKIAGRMHGRYRNVPSRPVMLYSRIAANTTQPIGKQAPVRRRKRQRCRRAIPASRKPRTATMAAVTSPAREASRRPSASPARTTSRATTGKAATRADSAGYRRQVCIGVATWV